MHHRKLPAITMALTLAISCMHEAGLHENPDIPDTYETITVPKENSLLYAMIPGLYDGIKTKSSEQERVSLESLIDRTGTVEEDFEEYHIVQIPFKEQEEEMSVILSDSLSQVYSSKDITIARKYLVMVTNRQTGEGFDIVTTFIPTADYLREYGEDSFSYMDKSTYEGIVINSELDGRFRSVYIYGDHPIIDGQIYAVGTEDMTGCRYYLSLAREVKTRDGDDEIDGGEITGSICIGTKPKDDEKKKDPDTRKPEIGITRPDGPPVGEGGGGGSGSDTGGRPIDDDTKEKFDTITRPAIIVADRVVKDDVKTYVVSLFSSGPGFVIGAGEYPKSKQVHCAAISEPVFSEFDRWTGDFSRYGSNPSFRISRNMEATAYFFNILTDTTGKRPCYNRDTGVYNPLKKMQVASPGASGLRGGTFGMVREHNTKNHSGIDLYAEEGTALYAMIDGIIDTKYVIEQPNLDPKGDFVFPKGYSGDKNEAGNRIYLKGRYDGKNVRLGYWHLQAVTPVAINPRTGKPFRPGDRVYKGEFIAYTGRTGNAYKVPNKHLHLTYEVNGVRRNPEKILNGKVDWNETMSKVLSAALRSIKCDQEFNGVELFN